MPKAGTAISVVDSFDYSAVPAVDARKCKAAAGRIAKHQKTMACEIIAIGKDLLAVKGIVGHGLFGPWIKHHFAWTDRTAQRMMQAAEVFGKNDTVSYLAIDQSALYALSDDSCPDDVRDALLGQASKGHVITQAKVRAALRDYEAEAGDEPPTVGHNLRDEPWADQVEFVAEDDQEITEEVVVWSLAGFVSAIRREVGSWSRGCPQDELPELVEVLRDVADQIELQCVGDEDD